MPAAPSLSAECRLVYGTAPVAPDLQRFRACLGDALDWPRIVAIAEVERATPILWRLLEREGKAAVPPEAAERLRLQAMTAEFRMLRLDAKLRRTLAVFRERGIPVIVLKGAALVATWYGSFTARPMSDVDLLVRPEDAARARGAVIDSGWPETTDPRLLELLGDAHHLPHFVDAEPTGLRIELHVAYLPFDRPFTLGEDDLWRDARPAPTPYDGALVPSAAHLAYHACVHFAWSHTLRFGAWRTFRDISALLAGGSVDWDAFIRLAQATRAATSAYWTFRLARTLAGIEPPAGLLTALAPPTPEWARRAIERHLLALLAPGERPPCPSIRVERGLWMAALRPRWSGHPSPGRSDPEHRWDRVMGTHAEESRAQRWMRHLRGARAWVDFAARTLAGAR